MEKIDTSRHTDGGWSAGPRPNQLKVLIADGHNLVAEAVSRVLTNDCGFITSTANSKRDLLSKVTPAGSFDVILVDAQMDGMRGLETIHDLCKKLCPSKIVLFCGVADVSFVNQAIQKGAMGVISKEMRIKAIESAIRLVHTGEPFLPATLSVSSTSGLMRDQEKSSLCDAEKRVLELTANGQTNKEIAIQTGLTEIQIKMMMRTICKKLDAKNRTHAVVKALECMII